MQKHFLETAEDPSTPLGRRTGWVLPGDRQGPPLQFAPLSTIRSSGTYLLGALTRFGMWQLHDLGFGRWYGRVADGECSDQLVAVEGSFDALPLQVLRFLVSDEHDHFGPFFICRLCSSHPRIYGA